MRTMLHKARAMWCAVTHRCQVTFSLDDLKHDDPEFASHMNWMEEKQHGASDRRHQRQRHHAMIEALRHQRHQGGPS